MLLRNGNKSFCHIGIKIYSFLFLVRFKASTKCCKTSYFFLRLFWCTAIVNAYGLLIDFILSKGELFLVIVNYWFKSHLFAFLLHYCHLVDCLSIYLIPMIFNVLLLLFLLLHSSRRFRLFRLDQMHTRLIVLLLFCNRLFCLLL